MSLEAPLKPLLDGWHDRPFSRPIADSVQHVVELFEDFCRIFSNPVDAIESLICVDRVDCLEGYAGLFEGEGK
jgi:hypothetical protein